MRIELAATVTAAGAVALALAPTAAFATDYLSVEEAARVLFPQATRFEPRELVLDAAAMQQLQAQGVNARSQRWSVQVALAGEQRLGIVVVDEVIGKFERITYAVGITQDGRLRPVEVLAYRESHGHEIRLPAWRRQFEGRTAASPLRVGEDIANISGATLSCTHVTDGVRRIAVLVDWARREGRL